MSDIVRLGRGAWPNDGRGGTLSANGLGPGRYYALRRNEGLKVGEQVKDGDSVAVHQAVLSIQRLLNRAHYRLPNGSPLPEDGIYSADLVKCVVVFQTRVGVTGDGVFGPATAQKFYVPTVRAAYGQHGVDWKLGYGLVTNESAWDPGAVGYIDPTDLGLCQINGKAHPELSAEFRLNPESALMWQADFVRHLIDELGSVTDAIAGYNLGVGGAKQWVAAGRPETWVPPWDSSGRARNVQLYIDRIMASADKAPN